MSGHKFSIIIPRIVFALLHLDLSFSNYPMNIMHLDPLGDHSVRVMASSREKQN